MLEKKFNQKLPGVNKNRNDIEEYILRLSDYENGMRWFFEFMRITNKKKHVQLVRQDVEEFVSLEYGGISLHATGGIEFASNGAIKSESGELKGPFRAEPGRAISDSKGKAVIPGRDRELIIRDHWVGDNSAEFANHCHLVIGDVATRLISDPVELQ